MPSLTRWEVSVECRKVGAIGIFTPKLFTIRADDPSTAAAYAFADAQAAGLETRGIATLHGPYPWTKDPS